jgi:hypothetical protein
MTTIRMFAFVAAVLITAFLFRGISYGLVVPQQDVVGTSTSSPTSASAPSTVDTAD